MPLHSLDDAWQAFRVLSPYALLGGTWVMVAARLVARKARRMTAQHKATLLRRAPRLAGLIDMLLSINVDGPWFGRALRTIALGEHAPGVIATLDALDRDPDADGITLTGLPSMRLIDLPTTVYPPPPHNLASPPKVSERYVVVRSGFPPPLPAEETHEK